MTNESRRLSLAIGVAASSLTIAAGVTVASLAGWFRPDAPIETPAAQPTDPMPAPAPPPDPAPVAEPAQEVEAVPAELGPAEVARYDDDDDDEDRDDDHHARRHHHEDDDDD